MCVMAAELICAPAASQRLEAVESWLDARGAASPFLVVAASMEAAHDLVRALACRRGALLGCQRMTLYRLAAELAAEPLAAGGLAPVGRLGCEAMVARLAHERRGRLGRYAAVADAPGLPQALAATIGELRLGGVWSGDVSGASPELSELCAAYEDALSAARLIDRAGLLELAAQRARAGEHWLLGLPLLLLDVPLRGAAEAALVEAVASAAPSVMAAIPAGDEGTMAYLEPICRPRAGPAAPSPRPRSAPAPATGLARLQRHLFEEGEPDGASDDGTVVLLSAPGEGRECVEIARRVVALARLGVPFDEIAILLRSPEEYRAHLEEALARAEVPVYVARGVRRPDPAGRAFLALLRCAAARLSARAFAEYLSLGEVPEPVAGGGPPEAAPLEWVPPEHDLVPERIAASAGEPEPGEEEIGAGDGAPGSLRAPRHWEELIVEASVIGGLERWRRRLDGLERELSLDLAAVEDPSEPLGRKLSTDIADLRELRAFALPLLADLDRLPSAATWGEWLERLSALATRALRHPQRVRSILTQLAPLGPVGPVDLAEVIRVLRQHLLDLAQPPPARRGGRVFVAPAEAARGMSFQVVFVPGLAERLFPRKIAEDPILLDRARAVLNRGLATNADRVREERLALRLAIGAARHSVVLSYPRLDLELARPRVPSFYALEAMRAAEGALPLFDDLARRAERVAPTRVGWPAPARPEDAIDEAEYDLGVLESLLDLDPQRTTGAAHYLLGANPHLARSLRFRARRWLPGRWTGADGLVDPAGAARLALDAHRLAARPYSPTALQTFAICPYKFLLHAIHGLTPREEPVAIEELSPLQRGALVHEVQFELLGRLRQEGMLPVRPERLERAWDLLDLVLGSVAERYREELAPAIERVWEDGIAGLRADLREWLRRASADASGFVPWRFELSFGLSRTRRRDPGSVPEPVELESGIRLRGAIDLVERNESGALRVTDHKTGKTVAPADAVVEGGAMLQPVLYGLAAERIFAGSRVESGRLEYCTAAGGFQVHEVPLDELARQSIRHVADTIDAALASGFLPAAPRQGACAWCDYQAVCGPHEERRVARKPKARLEPLVQLRRVK
jgi:RecB family exonuclease